MSKSLDSDLDNDYFQEYDPTGAIGHAMADIIYLREKAREAMKKTEKRTIGETYQVTNSYSNEERELAFDIYRAIAEQRLPIVDSSFIIKGVMEKHRYTHIFISNKKKTLNQARGLGKMPGFAISVLSKYELPLEPMNYPDFFDHS